MNAKDEVTPACWVPFIGPAIAAWQGRGSSQSPRQVLARQRACRWVALWAIAHTLLSLGSQQGSGSWQLRWLYLDGLATTGYLCLCLLALYRWRQSR